MEMVRTLDAPCGAEEIFPLVDDLAAYRRWMPLVHDVEEVAARDGEDRAWDVQLRAKVGPFARSKRLRMARTAHRPPTSVVFERAEVDGRSHADWVLRATVDEHDAADTGVTLTMSLHYGGSLWTGAALQRVLDHDVERGSENLVALVAPGTR
jgi:carbon monoxide dehydrogenase subunit G